MDGDGEEGYGLIDEEEIRDNKQDKDNGNHVEGGSASKSLERMRRDWRRSPPEGIYTMEKEE